MPLWGAQASCAQARCRNVSCCRAATAAAGAQGCADSPPEQVDVDCKVADSLQGLTRLLTCCCAGAGGASAAATADGA